MELLEYVFQLTRPLWGVTLRLLIACAIQRISTHTPLVGRDRGLLTLPPAQKISTHTPLVGRDRGVVSLLPPLEDFNSHAPCGA